MRSETVFPVRPLGSGRPGGGRSYIPADTSRLGRLISVANAARAVIDGTDDERPISLSTLSLVALADALDVLDATPKEVIQDRFPNTTYGTKLNYVRTLNLMERRQ